ncbi:hypothetical protein [Curvibacter sp. PAE-UM]|uniref:hypothetical protein n=1 Tax=Curvibacter sp. PAE-UM TaxID=1714344 RepID=UPI00070EC1B2|nr:hypothetical protein [Curvibacter sp. PAE-UM]KRI00720.1 hypothetical protein AO057_12710 [Curvibacter sp. PAE-UM]
MNISIFISKLSLIFFVSLGTATGTIAQPVSQNKAPSTADRAAVEVDFWKSVERMDTADAYAAYLDAYPNGRFALLARLAMKRSSGNVQPTIASTAPVTPTLGISAPAVAATITQPQVSTAAGRLNAWAEPASGAIPLGAGHRVRGPGVITVGRLGARKQLPIPEGEWVVVAATDHDSDTQPRYTTTSTSSGPGAVKLTTLTLAQFEGTTAKSLLVATFNRIVNDMPRFSWKGAEQCAAADQAQNPEYHHIQSSRSLNLCVQLRHEPNGGIQAVFVPAHRKEINQNLDKLGGQLGAFNTELELYLVDRYGAYMRITRLDCTEAQRGRPACGLPGNQPVGLATQVTWSKAYAQQAYTGFDRNLALLELSSQAAMGSTN